MAVIKCFLSFYSLCLTLNPLLPLFLWFSLTLVHSIYPKPYCYWAQNGTIPNDNNNNNGNNEIYGSNNKNITHTHTQEQRDHIRNPPDRIWFNGLGYCAKLSVCFKRFAVLSSNREIKKKNKNMKEEKYTTFDARLRFGILFIQFQFNTIRNFSLFLLLLLPLLLLFSIREDFSTLYKYIQWNWWLHFAAMLCYYRGPLYKMPERREEEEKTAKPYELWIRIRNIMISSCEHSHLSHSQPVNFPSIHFLIQLASPPSRVYFFSFILKTTTR